VRPLCSVVSPGEDHGLRIMFRRTTSAPVAATCAALIWIAPVEGLIGWLGSRPSSAREGAGVGETVALALAVADGLGVAELEPVGEGVGEAADSRISI